jgi:hypothetical protein
MKTKNVTFYLKALIVISLFAISCKHDTNSSDPAPTLNLVAPSGQRIASSIEQLKLRAYPVIIRKNGALVDFTITKINYYPVKTGLLAEIKYISKEGIEGNFILQSSHSTNKSASISPDVMRSYSCSKNGACQETCAVQAVQTPDGTFTVTCSCSECKMNIDDN